MTHNFPSKTLKFKNIKMIEIFKPQIVFSSFQINNYIKLINQTVFNLFPAMIFHTNDILCNSFMQYKYYEKKSVKK